MKSGEWFRVDLQKSFKKAKLQDIDDIMNMRKFSRNKIFSLQCVACEKEFDTIVELDSHVKNNHTLRVWVAHNQRLTQYKPYFCQKCHFCFNTEDEFYYHLETKYCEFNQSSPYSNLRKTKHSISMTPNVSRLTKMELEGAANFDVVKKIPKQKRTNYKIMAKINSNDEPFPCFVCEREFSEVVPFQTHLRSMHGVETWVQYKSLQLPQQQFRCSKCNLCFPSIDFKHDCNSYQNRVEECAYDLHNQAVLDSISKKILTQLVWACPVCDDDFQAGATLYRHILKQHSLTDWVDFRSQPIVGLHEEKCKECGIYFRHLVKHDCQDYRKKIRQSGLTDLLPCNICGEEFSIERKNGLYNHLNHKHGILALLNFRSKLIPGYQEYQCPDCHVYCARPPFPKSRNHTDCDDLKQAVTKFKIKIELHKIATGKSYQAMNASQKPKFEIRELTSSDSDSDHSRPTKRSRCRNENYRRLLECPYCSSSVQYQNMSRHMRDVHTQEHVTKYRQMVLPGLREAACRNCGTAMNHLHTVHGCQDKLDVDWPPEVLGGEKKYFDEKGCLVKCELCTGSVWCPTSLMYAHVTKMHHSHKYDQLFKTKTNERSDKCGNCEYYLFKSDDEHVCSHDIADVLSTPPKRKRTSIKNEAANQTVSISEELREHAKCPGCPKIVFYDSSRKGSLSHRFYEHLRRCVSYKKYIEYRQTYQPIIQEYKCDKCGFYFSKPDSCMASNCSQNIRKIKEAKNMDGCTTESANEEHEPDEKVDEFGSKHLNSQVDCPLCSRRIYQSGFMNHLKNVHSRAKMIEVRSKPLGTMTEKCPRCFLYFGTLGATHSCEKYVELRQNLGLPVGPEGAGDRIDPGMMDCPICNESMFAKSYSKHLKRRHTDLEIIHTRSKPFLHFRHKCDQCHLYFGKTNGGHDCQGYIKMRKKLGIKFDLKLSDNVPDLQEDIENQSDSTCEKTTTNRSFECPLCDQITNSKKFTRHIQAKHNGSDILTIRGKPQPGVDKQCSKCQLYFSSINAHHNCAQYVKMRQEQKMEEEAEQKNLKSDGEMDVDMVEPVLMKFECPECDKKLKKAKLFRHLKKRHGDAEYLKLRTCIIECVQEYRCPACYFVFSQKSKPNHQCEQYSSLTGHIDLDAIECVGKVVNDKVIYENDKQQRLKLEKRLELHCDDCATIGSTDHYCPFAEAKKREKEPTFNCGVCEKEYANEGSLFHHYKEFHTATEYVDLRSRKVPGHREAFCPNCEGYYMNLRSHTSHHCRHFNLYREKAQAEAVKESDKLRRTRGKIKTNEVAIVKDEPKDEAVQPQLVVSSQMVEKFECPYSKPDSPCRTFKAVSGVYSHVFQTHGVLPYLEFRLKPVKGYHEIRCDECKFYYSTYDSSKSSSHKCEKNIKMRNNNKMLSIEAPSKKDAIIKCPHCPETLVYEDKSENFDHLKHHGQEVFDEYKKLPFPQYCASVKNGLVKAQNCSESLHLIDSGLDDFLLGNRSFASKSIECPECRKILPNIQLLYFHLTDQHTREQWLQFRARSHECQSFQCKDCFIHFPGNYDHECDQVKKLLNSSGDDELVAVEHCVCPYCPRLNNYENDLTYDVSFYYEELIDHVKKKHPDMYTTFRLTEMAIQPFKCDECLYYFHSKADREKHVKSQCKKNRSPQKQLRLPQVKSPTPKLPLLAPGISHKEPTSFMCPHCTKWFPSFVIMDGHFRNEHSREAYLGKTVELSVRC